MHLRIGDIHETSYDFATVTPALFQARSVLGFADAETRNQLDITPAKRRGYVRREVHPLDELPRLKQELRTSLQPGARIEREPYRPILHLVLALDELEFGQLADR